MKIGLIGCGGMGTTHNLALKALSQIMDVEVTAIADCRPEYLDRAAEKWPGSKKYQTGMDLIEQSDVEVVHICLPSYMHCEHAVAAMKKGIHTFIEKPVCLTKEDGERLLEVQKETGVTVMVGHVIRSFPEYVYLKNSLDHGDFGALKSIVMQRVGGDPCWGYEDWFHDIEKSGSVVLDLHIHDLDFLRYMLGEPDSYQVESTAFDSGMPNQIITTYRFKEVKAMAEGVWDRSSSLPFEASFRAAFEEATIVFRSTSNPSIRVYHKDGSVTVPGLEIEYEMEDASAGINITSIGPYYTEIKYFMECIMSQQPVTRAPLSEGVASVNLGISELRQALIKK